MKYLLSYEGSTSHAFVFTGVIRHLLLEGSSVSYTCSSAIDPIFRYSGATRAVEGEEFDVALGFPLRPDVKAVRMMGFDSEGHCLNHRSAPYWKALNDAQPSERNLFRLIFSACDLLWRGQGYGIRYFPKVRSRKSWTGVLIENTKIKQRVESIRLKHTKMVTLQNFSDILEQIDEVNRCKYIITDSELVAHISLALRKELEYLQKPQPTYMMEMFGSGRIHNIEAEYV